MRNYIILLLLPIALLLNSCKETSGQKSSQGFYNILNGTYKHSVPLIRIDSARQLQYAVFLDVRTAREYEVSKIPGAQLAAQSTFTMDDVSHLKRDTTIVVYCSVGYRSERVGELLRNAGYRKVYNLYGGIFEWVNLGNAVVKPNGAPTEEVHAYSRAWGVWLNTGEKVYN